MKFLAHKAEPKKDGEGGFFIGAKEQKKSKVAVDSASANKSDKYGDAKNPMNQTSVGASMQELKQMHRITAKEKLTTCPDETPCATTIETTNKVGVSLKIFPIYIIYRMKLYVKRTTKHKEYSKYCEGTIAHIKRDALCIWA